MNGRKCGRDGMWMIETSSDVVLFISFFLFSFFLVDTSIRVEIFSIRKILASELN